MHDFKRAALPPLCVGMGVRGACVHERAFGGKFADLRRCSSPTLNSCFQSGGNLFEPQSRQPTQWPSVSIIFGYVAFKDSNLSYDNRVMVSLSVAAPGGALHCSQ